MRKASPKKNTVGCFHVEISERVRDRERETEVLGALLAACPPLRGKTWPSCVTKTRSQVALRSLPTVNVQTFQEHDTLGTHLAVAPRLHNTQRPKTSTPSTTSTWLRSALTELHRSNMSTLNAPERGRLELQPKSKAVQVLGSHLDIFHMSVFILVVADLCEKESTHNERPEHPRRHGEAQKPLLAKSGRKQRMNDLKFEQHGSIVPSGN